VPTLSFNDNDEPVDPCGLIIDTYAAGTAR